MRRRHADAAIGSDSSGYEKSAAAAVKRLYPDQKIYTQEEAERVAMLEEHWDVIVVEAP